MIPCNSPRYFTLAFFLFFAGIMIAVILAAVAHHGTLPPGNPAGLSVGNIFPRLFLSRAGLALLILLVPFFLVWPWWFRHGILNRITLSMQLIVGALMIAAGWLSFSRAGLAALVLSRQIPVTLYLPYGIFELSAFVLAGMTAFITIDALRRYLRIAGDLPGFHPSDIVRFLISRIWRPGFLIIVLLIIAAVTEY